MSNDKGFFSNNTVESVVIALLISLSSLLPDREEIGMPLYAGHFYDPDSGSNYAGGTTNTAKKNAASHYESAVTAASNGNMVEAFECLGKCLHYIQDANVPHHAANIVSTGPWSSHSQFEQYAFENMSTFLENYVSIPGPYYLISAFNSVEELTHLAAEAAKLKMDDVNDAINEDAWAEPATYCLKSAARYSAMVMYKFSGENSVPFYNN